MGFRNRNDYGYYTEFRGVNMAKKIIEAWIQQTLEFDTKEDAQKWWDLVDESDVLYHIDSFDEQEDGTVRVTVMKQYNKNYFPFTERR